MIHIPQTPAHLCILFQPDIAAVLTPDDCIGIACKVSVAFLTNVDDDFSITRTDLQRHRAIIALGVAVAESADKSPHHTYPSLGFSPVSMKSYECRVAFYATADNFRRIVDSSLVFL